MAGNNAAVECREKPTPEGSRAMRWKAVKELPPGPLDIVGDVHGEIEALESLLAFLGYSQDGTHPMGRTIVFVGDLVDRGPDSPGVVRWVGELVERGRALCVMGNHDLNAVIGRHKDENTWLFGHDPISEFEKPVTSESERNDIIEFLGSLALALEREDLRVVHAYWDENALARLADEYDPAMAFNKFHQSIDEAHIGVPDEVTLDLAHQNQNPMKLITSGPEFRAPEGYSAGGKPRKLAREVWWDNYDESVFVVFGHYWRIPIPSLEKEGDLFEGLPLNTALGPGKSICIDYSVGGRHCERREGRLNGPFAGRLAALRWPEQMLVFDDGESMPMVMTSAAACGAGT